MSGTLNFLDGLIDGFLSDVHTSMPALIERFDPQTMKADVKPLFRKKFKGENAQSMPLISNVPVATFRAGGFIIRPPYKKGDKVLLVFSERALDNVISTGKEADPEFARKFSLDDAVVIGGIMPFSESLPSQHGEDLIIAKEDFQSKIVIKANGEIEIATDSQSIGVGSNSGNINVNTQQGDIGLSTSVGDVNITSSLGNVNISGKDSSGSW